MYQQTVPLSKLTFPQWTLSLIPIVGTSVNFTLEYNCTGKIFNKRKTNSAFLKKKSCLFSLFCFVFKCWNGIILQHNLSRKIQICPQTNCVSEMWLGHSRQPDVMSLTCKQQQCHHNFLRISSRENYGWGGGGGGTRGKRLHSPILTPPYLVG